MMSENRSRTAKRPLIAANLALLMLTGCVGAAVDTSLHSAQLQTAGYAGDTGLNLSSVASPGTGDAYSGAIGQTEMANLAYPVPVPSPLSDTPSIEMALGSDIATTEPTAAVAALDTIVPDATSAVVPAQTATLTTASANNELSVDTPAEGIQDAVTITEEPIQTASLETQPKEKPKTFFELLFQKRTEAAVKKPTVSTSTSPVLASANPQATSTLPGVGDNKTIFGIDEDAASDDAQDDGIQVASIGGITRSLSPTGLILQTDAVKVDCFKPELVALLKVVERHYGKKVIVTSGYRSPQRNKSAGGVRNSSHIYCKAADIQIEGVSKWDLAKYLRTLDNRGGVGTYCRTESVHIDVGTQRDWHHPCRRKKSKA
jgi:uncharacterized protein YcbK (DUF882 family)